MVNVIIGIVGVCGAGKTTLAANFIRIGVIARPIAQEHSYVKDMWKRLTNPSILIFLSVSYENTIVRRKLKWTRQDYEEQLFRLRHAKQNAQIIIDTDNLSASSVFEQALEFLKRYRQELINGHSL